MVLFTELPNATAKTEVALFAWQKMRPNRFLMQTGGKFWGQEKIRLALAASTIRYEENANGDWVLDKTQTYEEVEWFIMEWLWENHPLPIIAS